MYIYILINKYISYFIKMRGGFYPAKFLMRVLSVQSSNKGNAYPWMPEFCPL